MKFFIRLPIFVLVTVALLVPMITFAQTYIGLENPIGVDSITELIQIVVKTVRYVALPFIVIMIMYTGFLYIWYSASGNSKKLGEAHKALGWTILGTFVVLSAELIAEIIKNTLN